MKVVLERNLGFMGYPNYSVDTEGNVWNVIRGHKLKYSTLKEGYMLVMLYNNGARKSFLVHRLVAIAFIPNPNKYSLIIKMKINVIIVLVIWNGVLLIIITITEHEKKEYQTQQKVQTITNLNLLCNIQKMVNL